MKKSFLILLVLVLSLAFCSKNGKEAQALEKKPLSVKVAAVRTDSLVRVVNYKGTVQAWKTANIIPDISGRIGRIYKKQGDLVKKGDLLAELDLTQIVLQQKQAQAAVAVAESAYKDAQLNYERMNKLAETKAASQMMLEKAKLALDAADTQLKSARANLDLVDYTLKNSSMRAPFDGVVAAKNMEEGDMINPMMGMGSSVLTVLDLDKVKVAIDIAAEDIEKVQIGQPCTVRVASLPAESESFRGKVYSKNLAADPASKSFKAEVVIDNPGMKIKSGVYADIAIEVYRKEQALVLPLSALVGNQVLIYDQGFARKKTVRVGVRNDSLFEVLAGVTAGEKVLIEGNYDLKDGSPIKIVGEIK